MQCFVFLCYIFIAVLFTFVSMAIVLTVERDSAVSGY